MQDALPRQLHRYLAVLILGTCSVGAAEISFKTAAHVRGSIVRLVDVATVEGGDEAEAESLRAIELFPAPSQSQPRLMRAVEIRQLLYLHGIDFSAHQFTGAAAVRITRDTTAPPSPPAELPAEIVELPRFIVCKRAMLPGEIIREVDVELRSVEQPRSDAGLATSSETVVGMEVMRPLQADQLIDIRQLRKPLLIQRGQVVSVAAKSAGVVARSTARALENGAHGDLILLESIDSKQKYSAIVSGPQQAEVLASGVKVPARKVSESKR